MDGAISPDAGRSKPTFRPASHLAMIPGDIQQDFPAASMLTRPNKASGCRQTKSRISAGDKAPQAWTSASLRERALKERTHPAQSPRYTVPVPRLSISVALTGFGQREWYGTHCWRILFFPTKKKNKSGIGNVVREIVGKAEIHYSAWAPKWPRSGGRNSHGRKRGEKAKLPFHLRDRCKPAVVRRVDRFNTSCCRQRGRGLDLLWW